MTAGCSVHTIKTRRPDGLFLMGVGWLVRSVSQTGKGLAGDDGGGGGGRGWVGGWVVTVVQTRRGGGDGGADTERWWWCVGGGGVEVEVEVVGGG